MRNDDLDILKKKCSYFLDSNIPYRKEINDVCEALLQRLEAEEAGYVLVPKELTAENGAKAALIGEFEEVHQQGGRLIHVQISWTTIKEIYKAAVAHFAASPQVTGKE